MEDLEKDFGGFTADEVKPMPPLFQIEVHKCIAPIKVPSKAHAAGYYIKSTERIDRMYMFDTAALYRMSYWLAKHYREEVGGGTIERCKQRGMLAQLCKLYGEWNLRIRDRDGNKRYIVSVEPVVRQIFQPRFNKH